MSKSKKSDAKINSELLKGSAITLVLTALKDKSLYGYELIKDLERRSEGLFQMNEGTLYPLLHDLEKKKAVEAYWQESPEGRKRRYYRITKKGRALLKERAEEWKLFRSFFDRVLAPARLETA